MRRVKGREYWVRGVMGGTGADFSHLTEAMSAMIVLGVGFDVHVDRFGRATITIREENVEEE